MNKYAFSFLILLFCSICPLQGTSPLGEGRQIRHEAVATADRFLALLQSNRQTEAWTETSRSFKDETPLPEFLQTVAKHSFLVTGNYAFVSIESTGNYAEIVLLYEKGKQLARVLLYMSKEEESWRIWGIRVEDVHLGEVKTNLASAFDDTPFRKSIEQFLSLIKKRQMEKAYRTHTTKEFQKSTDLRTFSRFFRTYRFFSEAVPNWQPIRFQGNDAYYLIFFVDSNGRTYSSEFQLAKEEKMWKVAALKVFKLHRG
jgi:hypothetical protein